MYSPSQAAKRANVHANTIRKWALAYGELLSPAARGKNGARLFNDKDVEVFCAIATLRNSGMLPDEVIDRIRDTTAPPVVDVALHEPPQDAPQAIRTVEEVTSSTQIVYIALQGRVEALERRVDSNTSQLITGLVIGAAITLVVVALVLRVV
jgi:DNA-binding transcriptional MerR regulator